MSLRVEPYALALTELRARLARGDYPSGARITATGLAAELGVSPTPVRESLARLAGEDLLEDRRREGHFVRWLSARDVADLYRLNYACVAIALAGARPSPLPSPASADDGGDLHAVPAADDLLMRWVTGDGGLLVARAFQRAQHQLSPVRRLEPVVLGDLSAEYQELAARDGLSPRARLRAVRRFYQRRISVAPRLAEALEPRPDG